MDTKQKMVKFKDILEKGGLLIMDEKANELAEVLDNEIEINQEMEEELSNGKDPEEEVEE